MEYFKLDESDLTSNLAGTTVLDQNGEKCALIKIFTTETGFSFDVGSLGVVKTEQKVGEIWVYVPFGIKKIVLSHPVFERLEYSIPVPIAKARTYQMKLISGQVRTIVTNAVTSQYVLFRLTPANAFVELDGQAIETIGGTATKRMPFGTYNYRIQAPRHAPEVGTIVVNDPKNKHIVTVNLRPQFANVQFQVENNAEIWIDDKKQGTGNCTIELGYGTYVVECRLPGHRASQKEIVISAENASTPIPLVPPTPIYGSLDINSSPADAEVWLDGKQVGTTPLFLSECLVGEHEIKVIKNGFQSYIKTITITEGETETEVAKLEEGLSTDNRTFTVNGVSFEMVFVEGGTFKMGATSEQGSESYDDEKPVHNVTLSDFCIGKTEVTQALWTAVMGKNPSKFKGDDLPVDNVSWKNCQNFIEKLNAMTGANFRLPTEAEWEYAARGGKKSKGYKYSGSNDLGSVAWYAENSDRKTHPVATKQPNELGLYDMSGNILEWCQDWYSKNYYSNSPQVNPQGRDSGVERVMRGGCWYFEPKGSRVSARGCRLSGARFYSHGLRLLLPVSQR
ncbi:MAG: SUMF1/EgtB/PvdO family nonheme iron enzyme [Bacteroidaceae bacterium]|nr:SUMF1/EgtB/PvdO family nonheme iron enzyme [Bacteroidaceae bacterium]